MKSATQLAPSKNNATNNFNVEYDFISISQFRQYSKVIAVGQYHLSVDKWHNCAAARYQGCTLTEHVGFYINRDLMQRIAAGYQPNGRDGFRFRLKGRTVGRDYDGVLMPQEAARLLRVVNAYRARTGLPDLRTAAPQE